MTMARPGTFAALAPLSAALFLPTPLALATTEQVIEYRLTFNATWSAATHPDDFPPAPHFSPLIGTSHDASLSLWSPGGIATRGVELVAETGSTVVFRAEIQSAINAGHANGLFQGNIFPSPGTQSINVRASARFPLVTVISMVAPTPDWFVGVHDLPLYANGAFIPSVTVELTPYDAGTDSGPTYLSPDADVTPHEPITNLSGTHPFVSTLPVGTFTFTAVRNFTCTADLAAPFGTLNIFDIFAYFNSFGAAAPAADLDGNGTLNIFDVLGFFDRFGAGC